MLQDKIYPVHKFLLQRNVRVQFLNIVKMHMWCDALALKFQKSLASFGFEGYFDKYSHVCIRDVRLLSTSYPTYYSLLIHTYMYKCTVSILKSQMKLNISKVTCLKKYFWINACVLWRNRQ